jgi:electron transfer flavoprotein alpha/beta subunit
MKEKGIADEIVALSCGPPKSEVTEHNMPLCFTLIRVILNNLLG